MSNYKLRPHHGLCTYFFKGKGYSKEFVENMTLVIDHLKENPEILLINKEDIICNCCPNNKNHTLSCFEKVNRYDNAVLESCNLSLGSIITFEDFQTKIKQEILEKGKLSTICGDCQWFDICNSQTIHP